MQAAGRSIFKITRRGLTNKSRPALRLVPLHRILPVSSSRQPQIPLLLRQRIGVHSAPATSNSSSQLPRTCVSVVPQCTPRHARQRRCSSLSHTAESSHLIDPPPQVSSLDLPIPPTAERKSATCSGCGSVLQCGDPHRQGYVPREKLQGVGFPVNEETDGEAVEVQREGIEEGDVASVTEGGIEARLPPPQLTCKRCFSLKHYNTALNVTLRADDYLRHLSHLREKRALILLVVDVIDFPGSLFPNLHTLVSPASRVMVVANKIDLLPKGIDGNSRKRLEATILNECEASGLAGNSVVGVQFTSVKTAEGLERLSSTVLDYWGNRGDIYLLGCTNVGKSSLFNDLLQRLCGASPGELDTESRVGAPAATVSRWPGTTLGLLSFPIMSVGKRKRLQARQARARELQGETGEVMRTPPSLERDSQGVRLESEVPRNRFWLHDTPGAINDAQLINLLTTKELNLALPKKQLKPRTFILKPGQCLLVGGLARLDYLDGLVSVYFTVFAAAYLPIHVTNIDKADAVWTNNLGTPLLKIPCGDSERLAGFPTLQPQLVTVSGTGWESSAADVVLSSAGWVAVTAGHSMEVCLMAHTPGGRGVRCRQPSLWPAAICQRGKRRRDGSGNRVAFTGR